MKFAVCILTILGCTSAFVTKIDLSNLKDKNLYVEPHGAPDLTPGDRIIGGNEVVKHSVPFQVAVFTSDGGLCGGSLIAANAVLTAAHCADGIEWAKVVLGAHNIFDVEDTTQTFTSRSLFVHPGWDSDNIVNDVAIIKLPSNAQLNENVKIVPLVAAGAGSFAGVGAVLTGWGRTTDATNDASPVLRGVNLNVITNAVCKSTFQDYITDNIICTSGQGPIGACNGDSGGPLVVDGTQVGIVSFGSTRCEGGYPSAYTRVSSYRSWIDETLE